MAFKKLPASTAHVVLPMCLAGVMTLIVSFIATLRAVGIGDGFLPLWMGSWAASWVVAFPTLILVLPVVRRFVGLIVEQPR